MLFIHRRHRRVLRASRLTGCVLALAAGAAITACSAPQADTSTVRPGAVPSIRIAHTWGSDSNHFTSALRTALASAMPGADIELIDSTAGVTNLSMLQRREVDAVSTYADVAYMASVGQLQGVVGAFDEIRAVAALPNRELQIVIAPQSPIRSIRDLRGRRVSLGPAGTGVAITAGLLLSAFGIDASDIRTEHLAFDGAVRPVMNGQIDAAFWGGRVPNPNIAAATRHGARLLQVVGPEIDRFRAEYPFLRATIIPAGTYPGIDDVVHTVGVDGIFVCRADLDERLVYNLTKSFFHAVATAGRDVRMLRGFNMSRAAATPLPLHPGAARYYREMEMRR
jgi:TRAP transporter TAXI family solute receptor